jgi:hypothetical protein
MAQSCLRRSGSRRTRLCLLVFDRRYEPVLTQFCSSSVYGIICVIVPWFCTILSVRGQEVHCYVCMAGMRMALGSVPLSHPQIPQLPCIRYSVIITAGWGSLLPFISVAGGLPSTYRRNHNHTLPSMGASAGSSIHTMRVIPGVRDSAPNSRSAS